MIDRREFVTFLLAALAAASAPAIAAPGRREMFALKWRFVPPGTEVLSLAEDSDDVIYGVPTIVTGVRKVVNGYWLWRVEYQDGHNVSHVGDRPLGRISVVETAVPDEIVEMVLDLVLERALEQAASPTEVERVSKSLFVEDGHAVERVRYLSDDDYESVARVGDRTIETRAVRWWKRDGDHE